MSATIEQVRALESSVDAMRRELADVRVLKESLTAQLAAASRERTEANNRSNELLELVTQARDVLGPDATPRVSRLERELERVRTNLENLYTGISEKVNALGSTVRGRGDRADRLEHGFRDRVESLEREVLVPGSAVRLSEQVRNKANTIDLNSTRRELQVLIDRVTKLEAAVATTSTDDDAPDMADLSDEELQDEICEVLSGVLDSFEGDDSQLTDYGEIRVKELLAELRSRQ